QERFDFACATIRDAGALALDYFDRFETLQVKSKGVQDMASEADVETQKLIEAAISARFPGDSFLGEEDPESYAAKPGAGTWIIDPIDGTQPFVNGIPSWCVSIAYVEGTEFRLGVVFDPKNDELFAAMAGAGATLNGRPIKASGATSVAAGLVSIGYSNRVQPEDTLGPLARLFLADGMFHRSGSGALSLAYVAAGRLIGYFEPHMNSWDFAASALIIKEAGGVINDCLPNEAALVNGSLIMAAAPGVYDELKRIVFS
ncbi:MAG: inositol monophosphatase, partial [Proteobacteria bacterium]|nr:inositol monophosphatase [Pseudomonadota bacterium]